MNSGRPSTSGDSIQEKEMLWDDQALTDPTVREIWKQICMSLNGTTESADRDAHSDRSSVGMDDGDDESDKGDGRQRRRKQLVCKGCNILRPHCAHGFCGSCYIREKIKAGVWTKENQRQCVNCSQIKRHYARGLCRNCYQKVISRPHKRSKDHVQQSLDKCCQCGEFAKLVGHGICRSCHYKNNIQQKTCPGCSKVKLVFRDGKCQECYVKSQMPVEEVREKDMKICSFCNQMKLIESNGRCAACRYRVILSTQQQQNGNKRENLRLCNVCKTMKKHCCRGMCQQCYYLEVTKKKLQAAGLLKNTQTDHSSSMDVSESDEGKDMEALSEDDQSASTSKPMTNEEFNDFISTIQDIIGKKEESEN